MLRVYRKSVVNTDDKTGKDHTSDANTMSEELFDSKGTTLFTIHKIPIINCLDWDRKHKGASPIFHRQLVPVLDEFKK
jgi:hypothetical protein